MKHPLAEELQDFHRFVGQKLDEGQRRLSPEEVLDEWRDLHPCANEIDNPADVVQAVRLALADQKAGDKGIPAVDVLADLQERLSFPRE